MFHILVFYYSARVISNEVCLGGGLGFAVSKKELFRKVLLVKFASILYGRKFTLAEYF
ncbi:MAG: hypothetical protein WA667_17435 [Candidatus Nitrosopolaris sp.]